MRRVSSARPFHVDIAMFKKGLSETYAALWKSVVRPPRDVYTLDQLGPERYTIEGKYEVERTDLRLKNARGLALECSHFVPISGVFKEGFAPKRLACVVYLHTSMGSRREAYEEPLMEALLLRGMSVFVFDQSGSGLSGGEYISVGHYEEKDLQVVIEHLRKSGRVGDIGFWGRSMGAITAINRLRRDLQIAAAVIDSPFTDLRMVGEELAMGGVHISIPRPIWNMLYEHIRSQIKSHVGIDPQLILPIEHAPKISCPVIVAAATQDTVVLPHHAEKMHDAWGCEEGNKRLVTFEGDHWDGRPGWFYEEASDFLERHLVLKQMLKEMEARKAAEERARVEAEMARALEEARLKAEAEVKKKAEAKKKAAAKKKAEAKKKAKAQEDEEERLQLEREAEEEDARRRVETEAMAREDADARRLREDAEARRQLELEAMAREDAESTEREIECAQAIAAAKAKAQADAEAAAALGASLRAWISCCHAPAKAEDLSGDAPVSVEDGALVGARLPRS